jgi:hypothetical protein
MFIGEVHGPIPDELE